MGGGDAVHTIAPIWKPEDTFKLSGFSFHHVGPMDQTPVLRLGGKCFYPLSYLTGLLCLYGGGGGVKRQGFMQPRLSSKSLCSPLFLHFQVLGLQVWALTPVYTALETEFEAPYVLGKNNSKWSYNPMFTCVFFVSLKSVTVLQFISHYLDTF